MTILTRSRKTAEIIFGNNIGICEWDYTKPADNLIEVINGSEGVINLAGASTAGKRWNEEYKKLIYNSRVITTQKISEAILQCSIKPEVMVSSSATGYYGLSGEDEITEDSPAGDDFLAKVCADWEEKAFQSGLRTVVVRTGVVLDKEEGALKKLLTPFKFFVGGHLGNGKQWFPWIHIDDLIELYIFALENKGIIGAINGTAPGLIRNKEFCKKLGKVMRRPVLFPVPGIALKIAVGEFANYLLTGRKILQKKTLLNGFNFKFANIESALKYLLK